MTRGSRVAALAFALLAAPLGAQAQPAGKVPRIGILIPAAPPPARQLLLDALREGLRGLGCVEEQTVLLEVRWSSGEAGQYTEALASLIRIPVDVIVVQTTSGAIAAKRATSTFPIVAASAGSRVESGAVASLARPGGNVTGLTTQMRRTGRVSHEDLRRRNPALVAVQEALPGAGWPSRSRLPHAAAKGTLPLG